MASRLPPSPAVADEAEATVKHFEAMYADKPVEEWDGRHKQICVNAKRISARWKACSDGLLSRHRAGQLVAIPPPQ
jgi:hypothetical protein